MGKMTREEAWKEYSKEPYLEEDLLEYFKKRLSLTDVDFNEILNKPTKSWWRISYI